MSWVTCPHPVKTDNYCPSLSLRSVVLGMGDGSMTTLTIADPEKPGITEYLKSLPSRNPEKVSSLK